MVEKFINKEGLLTWRYTLQELIDTIDQNAQNPYRLDADLELKDRELERRD